MENNKKVANYDFLTGIISVGAGLIYGILALNVKRSPMGNPWAPSQFPLMLAACMILFGLILVFRSNLDATKAAFQKDKNKRTANDVLSQKMIMYTVIAAIGYALILEHFGYVISTFLFVGFILSITNKGKWVKNVITALIFSVTIYYIFFYLLGISLPMTPFINL